MERAIAQDASTIARRYVRSPRHRAMINGPPALSAWREELARAANGSAQQPSA
jgi:hypothetical protein